MSESTHAVDHAAIDESVTSKQETSGFVSMFRTQPFWVMVAILGLSVPADAG